MLNEIVRRLNGHGEDPQSLEEALKLLADQKAAACAALTECQERRRQALLDDASDTALDKLEREIARAETRIEKLTIAEPSLRTRLSAAQAAARQRRWNSHRETYRAAAIEFIAAARAAAEKHAALVAIVGQARREGFEREAAAAMPPTPNIGGSPVLATDLLDLFELAVAGHSAISQSRAAAPAAAPAARLPHERQRMTDSQHQVRLYEHPAPTWEPGTPDDLAPLQPGEARVKVLRGGFSPADDRPQCRYGQIVRMPRAVAQNAANRGAVEVLETNEAPATTVVGADWKAVPAGVASLSGAVGTLAAENLRK
jgi:hypothetical protein